MNDERLEQILTSGMSTRYSPDEYTNAKILRAYRKKQEKKEAVLLCFIQAVYFLINMGILAAMVISGQYMLIFMLLLMYACVGGFTVIIFILLGRNKEGKLSWRQHF